MLWKFLKKLFRSTPANKLPTEDTVKADLETAHDALEKSRKPACFGELGGKRPEKDNRHTSWWGGNFLGAKGETVPKGLNSGQEMIPLIQIRVDELPHIPAEISDVALLTLWMDPDAEIVDRASNGVEFVIRTYDSMDGLIPLGPGYRELENLPTFQIYWTLLCGDVPEWEALEGVPESISLLDDDGWYFDHPARERRAELQESMPIKLGGHSQWWQSPQQVEGGDFVLFLDSTSKGNFGFPAGGNGNFFRTEDSWELIVDFT